MKTINQYLDALLSLPTDKKCEKVEQLIKNLQHLKWIDGNGGNDPVLNPSLIRRLETAIR